ncbi:MAG: hypothetical protein ABGX31_01140 [bacterium]
MFGNNSPNNYEIDLKVKEAFNDSGISPSMAEELPSKLLLLLAELQSWADENNLGKWKRSRIISQVELEFRALGVRGAVLKQINRITASTIWGNGQASDNSPTSHPSQSHGTKEQSNSSGPGCFVYFIFFLIGWLIMASMN